MSLQRERFSSLSLGFLENLYADYLRDPQSVSPDWRDYFQRMHGDGSADGNWRAGPSFRPASIFHVPHPRLDSHAPVLRVAGPAHAPLTAGRSPEAPLAAAEVAVLQDRVDQLIRAYRVRGHMAARLDPLGQPRPDPPELAPSFYRFTDADLERTFSIDTIPGADVLSLRKIIDHLQHTYCRSIGVQFMHIDDLDVRQWLQNRMESTQNRREISRREQLRILTRLTGAVVFEEFIRKKYLGSKSFSLEGAESLIPLLDLAIEKAGDQGLDEIVLAMAHRGRLNVLANIMGKTPQLIFREFEDVDPQLHVGRGDVKYHLGYSTDWTTDNGHSVHLSLCFNPSHLEYVNPVALGRLRAKQDHQGDAARTRGVALLIHGDAAFAGEGVVQETLLLSQLPGYATGGAIHVVVNNQIGFTTSAEEGRSSVYATDVAKMLQIPIFHVNGEDPEAVAQVVHLAMDFRRKFQRDVVLDMYCYRRLGHNEGDEPSFTQPLLYRTIERRKSVREGYLDHLLQLGGVTREEADQIESARRDQLEQELSAARSETFTPRPDPPAGVWSGYVGGAEPEPMDTGVAAPRLVELLELMTRLPKGFKPHPKIERGLEARRQMAAARKPLDWAAAEALALASLATSGVRVRFSGQDTARGTFSHRHAALHDVVGGQIYVPLANLAADQAPVEIFNSPLSENGVLGFEYGYSLDCPEGLVLWEAQFGDFCNAAQVIVDQFIASAELKWRRLSGLVLLLPHGFEGMGPEHSSARLERFLTLAADNNLQIVNPTTPAQYFHMLRRQVVRPWRKPLVVMTPKSVLRHPKSVSSLDDCSQGTVQRVLPDREDIPLRGRRRVLLCCGKIYYELAQQRDKLARKDVAIMRLEQLYPLPEEPLRSALAAAPDGTPVYWVQEEPENMGAWRYLRIKLGNSLFGRLPFAGIYRPESASPATGSASSHRLEQQSLIDQAFST